MDKFKKICLYCFDSDFYFVAYASTAGGQRNCNGADFASFKKYASHFLNLALGETEPKEAPNPVTGESGRLRMQALYVY